MGGGVPAYAINVNYQTAADQKKENPKKKYEMNEEVKYQQSVFLGEANEHSKSAGTISSVKTSNQKFGIGLKEE